MTSHQTQRRTHSPKRSIVCAARPWPVCSQTLRKARVQQDPGKCPCATIKHRRYVQSQISCQPECEGIYIILRGWGFLHIHFNLGGLVVFVMYWNATSCVKMWNATLELKSSQKFLAIKRFEQTTVRKVIKLARSLLKSWAHICARRGKAVKVNKLSQHQRPW